MQTAIIQAIGHSPASTSFAQALALLAQSPCLLVLDNLETPWEQDQRAVQDTLQILATTPNISLLASLRGTAPPPSPRWTRRPTTLQPLPEDEARRLFLDLAPNVAEDDPHLPRFLRALGGVPLAVELVALQAAGANTLRELWEEWQRRGPELAAHPDQTPDHRLTSLARSLDLSWQSRRLRDEGRRLFRLLGQLPAGISDDDRVALLGDASAEAARQLRAVGLAFERAGRIDLLPPVRDYARSVQPPDRVDVESWVRHYLSLAEDVGGRIFGAQGANALARLVPEQANLEAGLHAAGPAALLGVAVAALNGIARLWTATGAGSLASFQALADACGSAGEAWNEAECCYRLGETALARSEHDAARAAYEQALPLYRQVGDVQGEANCIQSLGDIALRRSEHDAARAAV